MAMNSSQRKKTLSRLQDHIGHWQDRLIRAHHTVVERRLKKFEITASQAQMLTVVHNEDADTVRGLSAALGLDAGAVTRLADRLGAHGLLERRADAADARSVRFALTTKGRTLVPAIAAVLDAADAEAFAGLSDAEVARYKGLLAKLLKAQGTEVPDGWAQAPVIRSTAATKPAGTGKAKGRKPKAG